VADVDFLRSLGFMVLAGAVFSVAAGWIRMPTIVAYLLAGLFIGPLTGLVEISHALELIAETGIVLLLFIVGLELSLEKARVVGGVALAAGIGQVAATALAGFAIASALGFGMLESAFLAAALTFSSTVVVVKLLDERHEMDSLHGRIAVGILLVQDVVAIVLLTLLAGLDGGSVDIRTVALGISKAFAGMALLLGVVLGASKWLLPAPFAWAARSPETNVIWSLSWCFLIVLGAQFLGLSVEIGAFLAGLSLAQLPYNKDLHRRLHPLMNFFIAVFFVSLGVQMDLGAALKSAGTVVLLSLVALLGKPLILLWSILRTGYNTRTAFLASTTLAQISEFSFILVAMGAKSNLVSDSILSITALVGLVTISISSYMSLGGDTLFRIVKASGILKIFPKPRDGGSPEEETHFSGHFIVVGINTLGREITSLLHDRGHQVLAVDTDPHKIAGLDCATMLGDAGDPATLEEAGLKHARMLITALQIEETNDLLSYRCREAGIPCVANVMDLSATENLIAMDTRFLLVPKVDGVALQSRELQKLGLTKQ
jgi:Kef-type K+ transport system membrane component KefB